MSAEITEMQRLTDLLRRLGIEDEASLDEVRAAVEQVQLTEHVYALEASAVYVDKLGQSTAAAHLKQRAERLKKEGFYTGQKGEEA